MTEDLHTFHGSGEHPDSCPDCEEEALTQELGPLSDLLAEGPPPCKRCGKPLTLYEWSFVCFEKRCGYGPVSVDH